MRETLQDIQDRARPALTDGLSAKEMMKIEMLSSFESFTRVMFKAQYGRRFIVNRHHRAMFKALQDVVDGKCTRLIINMPPRYSKTEVAIKNFTDYGYALNPKCKFLHLSYSDLLVTDNSNTIREGMKLPIYRELFPDSALEHDKGSATRWKTAKGGEFYAVSTQGQVTGFGAGNLEEDDTKTLSEAELSYDKYVNELLGFAGATQGVFQGAILIDDPIKPEDAASDLVRERINLRFETTIRNRVNSRKTPIIIIMQRLDDHDLCGYLKEIEPDKWTVLSLPAIYTDENGEEKALWEMKHTLSELKDLRRIDEYNFDTQYMQDPTPKKGLMYQEGFGTYKPEQLPRLSTRSWNYTDTADTGKDNLCSICFIDTPEYAYVTDILFTDASMEVTEPQQAQMFSKNKTTLSEIESNNGGRGYARAVKKLLRVAHIFRCIIRTFTQTQNKQSRIFSNSAGVMNDILFPEDWATRWPEFYRAIMKYKKKQGNQPDDAPDALTGVYEMHISKVFRRGGVRRTN